MKKIRNFQREDVTGFADAGATSSNYQSTLSPVGSVSPKQMRKKAKSVKEAYNRAIVEAAKVCPKCDNTGTFRQFGNTFPCDACGGDVRSANSAIIGTQARDMLATGKTTPVKEEVITSLDQITPVLEAYKPSDKLESRTKHLVRPKLSKMLQDRLAARGPKKKGYTPSQGTLGLAKARRAQMSHSKEQSPTGYPEEITHLGHPKVADKLAHKKSPHAVKEAIEKKRKLSAAVPGKEMSALSMKPMMGSDNNNRVSEEKTHVITSHSENGFWSDKDGWVYDKKSATKYHPNKVGHLPMSAKNDAKIVHKKDAPEKFDEQYSKNAVDKEMSALSMKPMMGSSNNNRMSEGFDQGTVTIHSPGHPLHGRKATVFYRHKDGRVNAQLRGPSHRAVQNLTLKPGEFKEHQKEETVNELSNSTLNSYIGKRIRQKAKAPAKQANVVAGVERATAKIDKKERRDAIMRNEAYSKSAVDKAIKRSGAKNSKAIHRLLKGHQKSDEPVPAKKSVKEEAELLADGKKVSSLKRKYMGKTRGTTDTGKPAHAIDIDPVLKSGGEINKVVK